MWRAGSRANRLYTAITAMLAMITVQPTAASSTFRRNSTITVPTTISTDEMIVFSAPATSVSSFSMLLVMREISRPVRYRS